MISPESPTTITIIFQEHIDAETENHVCMLKHVISIALRTTPTITIYSMLNVCFTTGAQELVLIMKSRIA